MCISDPLPFSDLSDSVTMSMSPPLTGGHFLSFCKMGGRFGKRGYLLSWIRWHPPLSWDNWGPVFMLGRNDFLLIFFFERYGLSPRLLSGKSLTPSFEKWCFLVGVYVPTVLVVPGFTTPVRVCRMDSHIDVILLSLDWTESMGLDSLLCVIRCRPPSRSRTVLRGRHRVHTRFRVLLTSPW